MTGPREHSAAADAPNEQGSSPEPRSCPSWRRRALLQLIGLWSIAWAPAALSYFAFALPAAGWSRWQATLLAIAVLLVPPATIVGAELLVAATVGARARKGVHALAAAILGAMLLAGVMRRVAPDANWLTLAGMVLGAPLAALAATRWRASAMFVSALSVAAAAMLAGFVLGPFESSLALQRDVQIAPGDPERSPVVMVIFDELPTTSLLNGKGSLDAGRVRNFARLAADATWYPNASTVADETLRAVPAIISGRTPQGVRSAAARENVFTLLGGSHRVNARESVTALCPPRLCRANAPDSLPQRVKTALVESTLISVLQFVPQSVRDALLPTDLTDAEDAYRDFARGIEPGNARFDFLHVLLPHSPFGRLPDGRAYERDRDFLRDWLPNARIDPTNGLPVVFQDEVARDTTLARSAWQTHLLQVGASDRLLGRLIERLRAERRYDRSLIVVTADHGAAFEPGVSFRGLERENAAQILGVPLFVKLPGQRRGKISSAHVSTTDIVPTISDALSIDEPDSLSGRSLLGRMRGGPSRVRAYNGVGDDRRQQTFSTRFLDAGRLAVARRQAAIFGPGTEAVEPFGLLGPLPGLAGEDAATLRRHGLRRADAEVEVPAAPDALNPDGRQPPVQIAGALSGIARGEAVAVLVNNSVVASTRVFAAGERERFSVSVPPSTFQSGANRIEVFAR